MSTTSSRPSKRVKEIFNGSINIDGEFYKSTIITHKDKTFYSVAESDVEELVAETSIHKLVVINQMFFDFLRKPASAITSKVITSAFNTVCKAFYSTCAVIALQRKLNFPIDQLIIDPNEIFYKSYDIEANNWFFYESKIFDCKELNITEDYYKCNTGLKYLSSTLSVNKKFDATIGYTNIYADKDTRKINFKEIRNQLKVLSVNVFCKDKDTGEDTFIEKPEYDKLLIESKFTLVFPSYNIKAFSKIRFLDAIASRCIPLILKSCNIDEAFSFEEQKLINQLLVSEFEICDKIKSLSNNTTLIDELYDAFISSKKISLLL
jgi:hypothetical protein